MVKLSGQENQFVMQPLSHYHPHYYLFHDESCHRIHGHVPLHLHYTHGKGAGHSAVYKKYGYIFPRLLRAALSPAIFIPFKQSLMMQLTA